MDSDGFDPTKKGLPILGIVLLIIGIIGYVTFLICNWSLDIISDKRLEWVFRIGGIIIFGAGMACAESAKKRKLGSLKMVRVAEVLSWGLIIALVIGFILRFFVH